MGGFWDVLKNMSNNSNNSGPRTYNVTLKDRFNGKVTYIPVVASSKDEARMTAMREYPNYEVTSVI